MEDFTRKFLTLAEELHHADGFPAVLCVDTIKKLVETHENDIRKDEYDRIHSMREMTNKLEER